MLVSAGVWRRGMLVLGARLELTTYSLWTCRRFYWVEGTKGQLFIGRGSQVIVLRN